MWLQINKNDVKIAKFTLYSHTSSKAARFSSFINNLLVNDLISSSKLAFSCKKLTIWK